MSIPRPLLQAAAALFLWGCQPVALSSPVPAPAAGSPSGLPIAELVVRSAAGSTPLRVEVASDSASLRRGLMFRRSVPSGTGMIFVFQEPADQTFWMKNTLVPLDMVFIGADHRIVGIVSNAEPLTTTGRSVHAPSQYVLEVAGGTAFAHGWRPGDVVEFHGLPPAR